MSESMKNVNTWLIFIVMRHVVWR